MTNALRNRAAAAAFLALILGNGPVMAHHPLGGLVPTTAWHGLVSGLAHPMIGPDHLAFLLAIGLMAGLSRWGVLRPMVFVLASLIGVATGWGGLVMPAAEWVVALSVLVAGLVLLARLEWRASAWVALLLVAGLAHGQAYAEAMTGAGPSPVLAYLVGLGLLQGGLVLGVSGLVRRMQVPAMVPRLAGAAAFSVGAYVLAALA